MSVEQKLRDNLKAAADALVIPQARQISRPKPTSTWRRGPGFALAGAAAVLALALPALFLWSGGGATPEHGVPSTSPSVVAESTAVPRTSSPTTTTPPTSTTVQAPDTIGATEMMDEVTFNDHTLALLATLVDDEEPQTATVVLRATPIGGTEPPDEAVVGVPAGFFWHVVTGDGALCEFSADQTDDGARVTVRIDESPSLGCSEPYHFMLDGDELTPDIEAPEVVAQQFVSSWEAGDEMTMPDLADPDALSQAREMSTPAEAEFSYCEGAAGSVYCTFEVIGGELVIRVRTEPPARVIEVISISDD